MSVLTALVGDRGVWGVMLTVAAGILDRGRIAVRHGICRQRAKDDRRDQQNHVDF